MKWPCKTLGSRPVNLDKVMQRELDIPKGRTYAVKPGHLTATEKNERLHWVAVKTQINQ